MNIAHLMLDGTPVDMHGQAGGVMPPELADGLPRKGRLQLKYSAALSASSFVRDPGRARREWRERVMDL